jgi:hypothetical protein
MQSTDPTPTEEITATLERPEPAIPADELQPVPEPASAEADLEADDLSSAVVAPDA